MTFRGFGVVGCARGRAGGEDGEASGDEDEESSWSAKPEGCHVLLLMLDGKPPEGHG